MMTFLRKTFTPARLIRAYLLKLTNRRVISGPFAGLYYVKESPRIAYYPKLLGTFEKELHGVIEAHGSSRFEKVVVIGAAEGYYAVGLAKKWKYPTLAFEADPKARQLLTRLSLINRVSLFVKGAFHPDTDTQSGQDFIFMDVEGAEGEILTPERFGQWRRCTLIVEIHSPALKQELLDRSSSTHHSFFLPVQPRTMADYPFTPPFKFLLRRWWWAFIQEWRSDSIGWIIFDPKQ